MVKVYYRDKEVSINQAKHLPFREEIFVSFDGGTTRISIHKDVNALKKAMDEGIFEFSYEPWSRTYMFTEFIQSNDEVSDDVMNFLVQKAKKLRIKLNIEAGLSLVRHPSVLKWLLKRGSKCKYIKGYGRSTMENFLFLKEMNNEFADELIELVKEYGAVDNKYLKKYADEWNPSVIEAFLDKEMM